MQMLLCAKKHKPHNEELNKMFSLWLRIKYLCGQGYRLSDATTRIQRDN